MSKEKYSQTNTQSPLFRRGFGGGFSEGFGETFAGGIMIANRGEIAVRIIRAARKLGLRTIAIYASDDAASLHVSMADQSILLSGNTLQETYLNQGKIIQIALKMGAEAIHPGYGFLSENATFAQKVADAGLVFIGPSPENVRLMGEKTQALEYVRSLGIPVLPSIRGIQSEILKHLPEMDFPVMVKASGGGGGKGMLICNSADELPEALKNAERQAIGYFGNGELFVEKYLPRARHIEVQLLADHHGTVLHFYERECSVQRRFQKIIEEAPSPSVDEKLRNELTSAAVWIAHSMNYRNAGTIEFLLDENGHFYFLEMNTRIQVEHPVTEMITNTDLVSLQMLVAAGNPLPIKQEDIQISGHAIEVRLCAEDAENQFHPSAGKLSLWRIPEQENMRIETFVQEGMQVSASYDSLLAKLISWGETRSQAISQMHQVLSQSCISGVHSNLPFLSGLLENEVVLKNKMYTRFVDENLEVINRQIKLRKEQINRHKLAIAYLIFHFYQEKNSGNSIWNQIGFWRISSQFEVLVDNEVLKVEFGSRLDKMVFWINQAEYQVSSVAAVKNQFEIVINHHSETYYSIESESETIVLHQGFSFSIRSNFLLNQVLSNVKNSVSNQVFQNLIYADLFGKVLKLNVRVGDRVMKGQILLTLESMKTEIHILCPADAMIKKIHVKEGNAVTEKQLLVELDENCYEFRDSSFRKTHNP